MKSKKISFGKYFDDQRDRIVSDMQNKNAQLWKEWREDFDKRQLQKQDQLQETKDRNESETTSEES